MCCVVGVVKVYFVFVVLLVCFFNVYGVDMLLCKEFVVDDKIEDEICVIFGVDGLIY